MDYQPFVDAMKRADQAMQDALRALPQDAPDTAVRIVNDTFRSVRATTQMAHGMKSEEEARG